MPQAPPQRAQLPNPRITRPQNLPRAVRPGTVPAPDHHHLPGWVRRAHGQAQPILADLMGALEGERRTEMSARLEALVGSISAGKFSQAWHYPRLIEEGRSLLEAQQRDNAEAARARTAVEQSRRRVSDQLRDNADRLPSDTAGRLGRALRSATDRETVAAVAREVEGAVGSVRTLEERRRDREIGRTRAKIRKALPKSAPLESSAETWQETLRRFAEQQAAQGS
ncbi:MAG: hypothetical protein ABR564_08070 [Candidatus Dormibacteria bacterium]